MPHSNPSPLVSVLLPAYNHEAYVRSAVESVLAQTHTNLELIVIDDASVDGTWEALRSFSDERIRRYRHETNLGADVTLNEALGHAVGQYLAILNSDDRYAPERLASCLRVLQDDDVDLVGTDMGLIDDAGNRVMEHWWLSAYAELKSVREKSGDWLATLLSGNVYMTTSNFVFRRSWFEAVGNFSNLRYVLDYDWLLRGYALGQKLAWLDTPLLDYRLHEHNTIAESPLRANLECAAMLRRTLPDLLAEGDIQHFRLEQLASQWARIERYIGEIADAQRHLALVAKEAELLPLIADRDRWIAERDGVIARQTQWIEDRDRWIAERESRIGTLERWIEERDALIETQKQWVLDRDGWIGERDRLIETQNQWIEDRDQHIAAQRQWIEDRDRWIVERDALIEIQKQWVKDRDQHIAAQRQWIEDRDRWIAERDELIEIQKIDISDRDRLIGEQRQWIADRDAWITERDGWIGERDRLIETQKQWVADRDHWIIERDELIQSQKKWIAERDRRVAEQDFAIGTLSADLTSARQRISLIERSTSYRLGRLLTAPARWLRTLFRDR